MGVWIKGEKRQCGVRKKTGETKARGAHQSGQVEQLCEETGRIHRELDLILDIGNLITDIGNLIFSSCTMMHLYHNLKIPLYNSDAFFFFNQNIFWPIQIIPVCSVV